MNAPVLTIAEALHADHRADIAVSARLRGVRHQAGPLAVASAAEPHTAGVPRPELTVVFPDSTISLGDALVLEGREVRIHGRLDRRPNSLPEPNPPPYLIARSVRGPLAMTRGTLR